MNSLQLKPEFNDLPNGEQPKCAANPGPAPEAALCNPAGGRRLRRRVRATHLAPPRDDGFHLFRVY
jgi:hypothetical protein